MHKIAVATMHNYSTHVFMTVNRVEFPHAWLFHTCYNTRRVHSTHGITRDMSIPRYGKCGPREDFTRFVLPMSCYHAFPHVEK